MSEHDTKPTPPSGMPAQVAATSLAKPSLESEEIVASSKRLDNTAILEAIAGLDTKVSAQGQALGHLATEVAKHGSQIGELASAQISTAKAASSAAEIATTALRLASQSADDNKKMIESAMTIQKGAIETAVREAVRPVTEDVVTLQKATGKSNEAVGAIVNELGIEDRVELGRDVKPGDKPPQPVFEKMDKRAKHSTIVQAFIAAGMIAELLHQIIFAHH